MKLSMSYNILDNLKSFITLKMHLYEFKISDLKKGKSPLKIQANVSFIFYSILYNLLFFMALKTHLLSIQISKKSRNSLKIDINIKLSC